LVGLACAIPIGWLTSLPVVGIIARRCGILVVPSEMTGLSIAAQVETLLANMETKKRTERDLDYTGQTLHAA
jgi:membrane glycosyltransferase